MGRDIRQRALQRIAALSAASANATSFDRPDLDRFDLERLCRACHVAGKREGPAGRAPMAIREFEVLIAICQAAPSIQTGQSARRLASQLVPYVLDAHVQLFDGSPAFRRVEPSPTEALAFHVTGALLALGIQHLDLQDTVADNLWSFVGACGRAADGLAARFQPTSADSDDPGIAGAAAASYLEDAVRTAAVAVALLGFLEAAAAQADFWKSGGRLALVRRLRQVLSDPFLTAVDAAFTALHDAAGVGLGAAPAVREWRRCIHHYAARGRPLGAMLLRRGFMQFHVAATSLMLISDAEMLRKSNLLDLLTAGVGRAEAEDGMVPAVPPRPESSPRADANRGTIEAYASIAADQMAYFGESADYFRIALMPLQRRLSFAVKAAALVGYLACAALNEEAADPDMLLQWLHESLEDAAQMADPGLGPTVLRCLAVLVRRVSPGLAPTATRLLARFIVQSAPTEDAAAVASRSLAFVLQALSQDAVISTLYTLGNVLSPAATAAAAAAAAAAGEGDGAAAAAAAAAAMATGGAGTLNSYPPQGRQSAGSAISLQLSGEEETAIAYGHAIEAICTVAEACGDEKITALAQSMLLQKLHRVGGGGVVDARIIDAAARLCLLGGQLEFRSLLRTYVRLARDGIAADDEPLLAAVSRARCHISANVRRGSTLHEAYWEHLMDAIISVGHRPPPQTSGHQSGKEKKEKKEEDEDVRRLAAREIGQLLRPLATLAAADDLAARGVPEERRRTQLRDAWLNMVVHGFGFGEGREPGRRHDDELRVLAVHSPPLVAEQLGDQVESDIELNTVLGRGMSGGPADSEAAQRRRVAELVPTRAADAHRLTYRRAIFLQAAFLVESLRSEGGDCSRVLAYFAEPCMRRPEVHAVMEGIAAGVLDRYLRRTTAASSLTPASALFFSSRYAAAQLAAVFCACCHRIERVRRAALAHADAVVARVPSALCHRQSLFALLELLSLMWTSCLEAETDRYAPRSTFTSRRGRVAVELSDDYRARRSTLDVLLARARSWGGRAMEVAPADVRAHLQTYLSEFYEDEDDSEEGAFGPVSLGRSLALELGSAIPSTDQRLRAVTDAAAAVGISVSAASDLVTQYTTRQRYRRRGRRRSLPSQLAANNIAASLATLETRILSGKKPGRLRAEMRDVLGRAAALLCQRSSRDGAGRGTHDHHRDDEAAAVAAHYLVSIPFALFTRQSIELGTSLWLGVMNENPRLGPRLLNEIALEWEFAIQRRRGLFSPSLAHPDPFFERAEFAPSDAAGLARRAAAARRLLTPHQRLLRFLDSHFGATRLAGPNTHRVFARLLYATMDAISHSHAGPPHPLAREMHLSVVLFGLRMLGGGGGGGGDATFRRRLADKVLTAALSWFRHPPRWSFGSDGLQLRTEIRLIGDVSAALDAVSATAALCRPDGTTGGREELLRVLLENERARLAVWANPLNTVNIGGAGGGIDDETGSPYSPKLITPATVLSLVRTAWSEHPSLAVELAARFQQWSAVRLEVRSLLRALPEGALADPAALSLLLLRDGHNGAGEPRLVQDDEFAGLGPIALRCLLVWAPVAPISAVTLFLPAYRSHPFVIQYAMRALESHPVEVTFFYVPQIVQTLRHDALGYVERYILEAAQLSRLFAHQIIWNMKANSYKDDDGQIPDEAIKPTLDAVMARMVTEFSPADREFYEREFSFFDEVTGISAKLKPLIRKTKPEKKQKIEEELRKIRVEVGVYLPSNPDGTVIGIDRKSGRPLQSHAKAPFMATFRIRRRRLRTRAFAEVVSEEADHLDVNGSKAMRNGKAGDREEEDEGEDEDQGEEDVDVWQSAIFKVGDDCRQDVLALQMIAAFRSIFHSVGLDVYVFPYCVTATAPGCGVIDVLPNAVSRDMLGREAVNGLYDYFVSKYGSEDGPAFQRARSGFVKSMAAYSVISFLLQFKDRHNGNIMLDDAGHVLHVDFGFCFDIAPGGIKFERAPFKLTTEMMAVMGGSGGDHQAFGWFEELCVKAFLASRQHADELARVVAPMMDSGLPCFRPESVRHLLDRFVLDRTDREAAEFMRDLIRKSHSSYSTGIYDQFQLLTNGIPY